MVSRRGCSQKLSPRQPTSVFLYFKKFICSLNNKKKHLIPPFDMNTKIMFYEYLEKKNYSE